MENQITFKELGLSEGTLAAIEAKGYIFPTPVQAATIPLLLQTEKDIIAQAQTGTGKTAAFGLPLIEMLHEGGDLPQALVLTPTRELAIQVAEEIMSYRGDKKLFVATVYGGASIDKQLRDLKKGVQIVVGTPGRVMDMMNRGALKLHELSHLILDEADEMLNMGFVDDIETILEKTPKEKRMLLFSATMPDPIRKIAKKYMGETEMVSVKQQQLAANDIVQIYYEVRDSDKMEALVRLMEFEKDFYGLIFCQTKVETDSVANRLIERGYHAEALHGDISQQNRERILNKFKIKSINILVATDVAARGIDIAGLTHVFNLSLPQDPESYVHRIGRTGRAGKTGTAVSFVSPREVRKLAFIRKLTKTEIQKGKLPGIEEIIKSKIGHIKDDVAKIIEAGEYQKFESLATELLESFDPQVLTQALLKLSFADQLDEANFSKIKDGGSASEFGSGRFEKSGRRERTGDKFGSDRSSSRFEKSSGSEGRFGGKKRDEKRLFIALGRLDNMSPRKLVEYLKEETGVPDRFINDVKVTDKFSFISVSERDAETILRRFKKETRGKRAFVEIASE